MPNAIIYCRVSTTKQDEQGTSLSTQADSCMKIAKELGATVSQIVQEVFTGAELYDRPKLAEVRKELKTKKYAYLICHSIDRLSRNPIHVAVVAEECERAGVELRFVTEPLDTSPEAALIRYVRGYAAQVEREKIRERVIRGRRAIVMSGRLQNVGTELYGYRRDKERGVRLVYEPEAIIVRRIFRMTAEDGMGAASVASALNNEGIPSPSHGKRVFKSDLRHSRWAKSTIDRIILNESYKGVGIAWKWKSARKGSGKVTRRDPKEHIPLPDGVVPAIVSESLWNAAQKMRQANRGEETRNRTHEYLLRGYVYCSKCGTRMYPEMNKGTRRYRCSSRAKFEGHCGALTVAADSVESWVWSEIARRVKNPSLIQKEIAKAQKQEKNQGLQSEIGRLQREGKRLDGDIQRWLRRLGSVDDDSVALLYERKLKDAQRAKTLIGERILELSNNFQRHQAGQLNFANLSAYCAQIEKKLTRFSTHEKRMTLQAFSVKVYASGKPSDSWKIDVVPSGSEGVSGTSAEYYSPNAFTIHYKKAA